jgi:hypothetical protein
MHCDFSAGSRLRAVKTQAFWNCPVFDITLPGSVREVERKAFFRTCRISIANLDPEKENLFRDW